MKKILVTGGAGFIGSHLCRRLLENGNEKIICLDNFSTGSRTNLGAMIESSRFEMLDRDLVFDPIRREVDQIYNLACPASPEQYSKRPIATVKTCIIGAFNVLEHAAENKARILQASTSEIYGDPLEHPQTENYRGSVNCAGPRACYDEGKRCAETLFHEYGKSGVSICVARIFNTYGPNMATGDGRVIPNFINAALINAPLRVAGDGSQTRSFCYIDDMVNGLIALMASNYRKPINLGNPVEITIGELAERVIDLTGSRSVIEHYPMPQDDPVRRRPDITLANRVLNWKPEMSLSDGLLKTVLYFDALKVKRGAA